MEIYTKEDFKQIFIDLGIEKGSKILLEADLSRYSGLVGNYQMLIETLLYYSKLTQKQTS